MSRVVGVGGVMVAVGVAGEEGGVQSVFGGWRM